ncbi:hypothetical protein HPB48_023116 [Haemaphysalis longicornis]|uniref:Uncharacterized protein n=1 Tax=Haemaphysalis longicornis TaxID=44386 RepID=A0A9J6H2F5_HAELO|nr:hypothetical protein HPB48_023116 [Haemaphysalis longicornis]
MAQPHSILQDPFLLVALKWDEIVDLLCTEVFSAERRGPLSFHGLFDSNAMDDGVFRTLFRFEKNDARRLERALLLPEVIYSAQRVPVPAHEALCLTLRRLAYPNRLCGLERSFGRHYSVISSVTNKVLAHIDDSFAHLLHDLNSHVWLDLTALEAFSQVKEIL